MAWRAPKTTALLVGAATLALASCGTAKSAPTTARTASAPGITSTSILLGSDTALSGPSSLGNGSVLGGIKAALAYVNATGGAYGRQISVTTIDNQSQQPVAAAAAASLTSTTGAFGLIGDGPTSAASYLASAASSANTIQLFPTTYAWPGPSSSIFLNPTVEVEAVEIATALAKRYRSPQRVSLFVPPGTPTATAAAVSSKLPSRWRVNLVSFSPAAASDGFGPQALTIAASKTTILVSFAGIFSTASLLASLDASNAHPAVVVTQATLAVEKLRELYSNLTLKASYPSTILRFSPYLPATLLPKPWAAVVAKIAKHLPADESLDYATTTGIVIGMAAVEEIEAAGVNPDRRVVLTTADNAKVDLPSTGGYSRLGGLQGGVLYGNGTPVYVTAGKATTSPPGFKAPPRL